MKKKRFPKKLGIKSEGENFVKQIEKVVAGCCQMVD